MPAFNRGDYVKFVCENEQSGEKEGLWLIVDGFDDEKKVVFGRLDNDPIVNQDLSLGQELAVSYDRILDHKKASYFDAS